MRHRVGSISAAVSSWQVSMKSISGAKKTAGINMLCIDYCHVCWLDTKDTCFSAAQQPPMPLRFSCWRVLVNFESRQGFILGSNSCAPSDGGNPFELIGWIGSDSGFWNWLPLLAVSQPCQVKDLWTFINHDGVTFFAFLVSCTVQGNSPIFVWLGHITAFKAALFWLQVLQPKDRLLCNVCAYITHCNFQIFVNCCLLERA